MSELRLGKKEFEFADIIWERAPIKTSELASICQEKLDWHISTMYTVLRRLCNKGITKLSQKTVTALMTKDEYLSNISHEFVEREYGGSLPNFIAAFANHRKLTKKEYDELKKFIDEQ